MHLARLRQLSAGADPGLAAGTASGDLAVPCELRLYGHAGRGTGRQFPHRAGKNRHPRWRRGGHDGGVLFDEPAGLAKPARHHRLPAGLAPGRQGRQRPQCARGPAHRGARPAHLVRFLRQRLQDDQGSVWQPGTPARCAAGHLARRLQTARLRGAVGRRQGPVAQLVHRLSHLAGRAGRGRRRHHLVADGHRHGGLDRAVAAPDPPGGGRRRAHRACQCQRVARRGRVAGLAALVADLAPDSSRHDQARHQLLASTLNGIRAWLRLRYRALIDGDDVLRRLFICLDLGITVMKGMFEDGVFKHGFDVINDIDFRAWLRKHGGDEQFSVNSAPVRGFYDLVFAYEGGDFAKPNIEAGTLLRAMARIGLAYKGGIMFKMQAGMGDTIFTPLYQVLAKRGVEFKFFQRVEELVPGAGDIDSIRITQQVQLKDQAAGYAPLVDVKGLACWPSAPDYAQIEPAQAALLQAQDVNLESYWSGWPQQYQQAFGRQLPVTVLKKGVDFDKVVFGISIGSLPALCPQLLAQSPALQLAAEKVQTVATQAYQVWLNKNLAQMGWTTQPKGQQPVLSAFTEPYDTWAPMDQLLAHEDWPAGLEPKNVSYFCSAFPIDSYPPVTDTGFPARCAERAKQGAVHQLSTQISALWPEAGVGATFPWQWLIDAKEGSGPARFDSQYWRANVDPSERYVMSVVGSTQYRLTTEQSGFINLFLTGDWISTGLNAGCVEAAVMAGMQTSRAMTGYPAVIQGEKDF